MPRSRLCAVATSAIALVVLVAGCGSGSTTGSSATTGSVVPFGTPVAAASTAPPAVPVDGTVSFVGVTVARAIDVDAEPQVTSSASAPAPGLLVQDVVAGTGAPATPTATVTVQYVGALYADGTTFDASWDDGGPAQFSLRRVVTGFAQGIGGTTGVDPMRTGGRRIMVFPADLGYGNKVDPRIPPGSSLVFVVDLTAVG